jgi:hypothetical protein
VGTSHRWVIPLGQVFWYGTFMSTLLVEPDDRGRICLSRTGVLADRYVVHRLDNGILMLEPAVVLGVRESAELTQARQVVAQGRVGAPLDAVLDRLDAEVGVSTATECETR